MMCFNCCVIQGGQYEQDWQRWGDHPVRKEYDVIMDLGEGAFSQVKVPYISVQSSHRTQACIVCIASMPHIDSATHIHMRADR